MKERCYRCNYTVEYEKEDGELVCPGCGWEKQAAIKWANTVGKSKKFRKSIFGIEFFESYFEYMDKKYLYSDIKKLDASVTNIKHSLNYMPNGKSVDVYLSIRMKKGKGKFLYFSNSGGRQFGGSFTRTPGQEAIISVYKQLKRETGL